MPKIHYDEIKKETKKAILYSVRDNEFWIPRSQITNNNLIEEWIEIPDWLYDAKGGDDAFT